MKKRPNWFLRITCILFIMFCVIHIIRKSGYYEKSIRDKTVMTQSQIEKFEQDVKEGKATNIESYLPKQKDYSNIYTKSANFISNKISYILNNKANNVWDFMKSLFIG